MPPPRGGSTACSYQTYAMAGDGAGQDTVHARTYGHVATALQEHWEWPSQTTTCAQRGAGCGGAFPGALIPGGKAELHTKNDLR